MLKKVIKYKNYVISFLIPFILLGIIYFSVGFFTNKTVLVSDMAGQYKMLFMFLKENGIVNYSFSKGLGGAMIGTYAYYLLSPFNLLVFLFPKEQLDFVLMLIIWLKLSLSGLTMYLYLKKKYLNHKYLYLFSTSYALMGYSAAYYFHIMWLDAILLLPILIYGIEKIINDKSSFLYFITLFMIIFCNYYIAYMVCIFSCLYFCYMLYINYTKKDKEKIFKVTKKFIFTSLLAGLSLMFILIPTIMELKNMPKSDMNIFSRQSLEINITPIKLMAQLFIGNHNYKNILAYNSYFIYTGIFNFILLILYFTNKKILKKEKKASFIILIILLLSIFINYIDYVWHGFNLPIAFFGRYIFLFSFFIITLSAKSFINTERISKKQSLIIIISYTIMGIFVMLGDLPEVKDYLIIVSVFLLILYIVLLNNFTEKGINILIMLLVFSELLFNYYFMINDYNYEYQKESIGRYKVNSKEIEKIKKEENKNFIRIGKSYEQSPIDSLYYGYNGNAIFLSTVDKNQINFLGKSGYNVHDNMIEYLSFMPVIDSVVGIKYVITDEEIVNLKKIGKYEDSLLSKEFYNAIKTPIYIYTNDKALSLGTVLTNDLSKCKIKDKDGDRLDYQNQIINCLSGVDDIFEKIDLKKIDKNTYKFVNDKNLDFYSFVKIKSDYLSTEEGVTLYINDIKLSYYSANTFAVQLFKNGADIGIDFTYKIEGDIKDAKPVSYYYNKDKYNEVFDKLNENQLKVNKQKKGYIKGIVTGKDENSYLFTTIPYDKGWNVYVDGKEVKYDEVFDTFIGFKIGKGKHNIEFKYTSIGLKEGILITVLALFLSIIYFSKEGKDYMKNIFNKTIKLYKRYKEIINYGIFGVLTTLVNIISYFILTKIFGIQYLISNAIALILAILFAYITNRLFVFESKNKNIIKELLLFFYYRLITSVIDMGLMYIFVSLLHFNDMIMKIISNIIVILLNYVFSKLYIFKNK